ncbi:MAG: TetR/AcrR family transcriptional regulator [Roseburia sp.]|nr:TetR/AcrR family transcriptional regulator [Roseburia sp.]MCM1098585.1 TetR/AcrR family transcriptional regulator [Ruminococcus flavefaciens]
MNTKGNQRAVQTEQKIKGVFLELLKEKEISRISVSEICGRAEIHRTTFYVHYRDVADLMEKLVGEMYGRIMSFFMQGEEGVSADGFLRLFEMIRGQKAFFMTYLEAGGSLDLGYDHLPLELQERVDEVMKVMGFESEEELFYHQTFFCEGLSAVIRRWIKRGCRESPEEMRRIIVREYNPNAELFLVGGSRGKEY